MTVRLLLFVLPLLSGCTHAFRSSTTVCPEYRDLGCATAPECSMDRTRGCQVCQCAPAGAMPGTSLPSGVPPDLR